MKQKKNQDENEVLESTDAAQVLEESEDFVKAAEAISEATDSVSEIEPVEVEVEVEFNEEQKLAVLLVKKEEEAKANYDKWQRTLAEFDNFRKRTIKERSQMYENGAKEVVEKLLPILDNFERALNHMSDKAHAEGIELIYKQFLTVFSDLGIEEIEAEGKAFDPNLHHAISHEENDDYGENQIIEVLQKGFIYKERVIRHSLVRVAN